MNVADVATMHSFKNTCDVNSLGRKKGIGNKCAEQKEAVDRAGN